MGTKGKGDQGANPGPKYGRGRARTAPRPYCRENFYCSSRTARAALSIARCPVCPLSVSGPGFWFWAPSFDESALQS